MSTGGHRPHRPDPRVVALASSLDAVFFAGSADDADVDAVDLALEGGLVEIGARLDADVGGDELRVLAGVFDLLDGLRHGRWSRGEVRLVAGAVLAHLLQHVDPDQALVVVVGALACLPDDEFSIRFDAAADPAVPLEAAIVAAVHDPSQRVRLRVALADAEVLLPVLEVASLDAGPEVRFATIRHRGRVAVAGYTSERRLRAHAHASGVEVEAIRVRGSELGRVLPARHSLVLNPGWVVGTGITETEARALTAGSR